MDNFSFLEQQLVQLLLRICKAQDCTLDQAQRAVLEQVVHELSTATREGTIALALASLEPEIAPEQLSALPVIGGPGAYTPLVLEDGYLWFNRYWHYEQRLADNLQARLLAAPLPDIELLGAVTDMPHRAEAALTDVPEVDSIDWQQRAISLAARSRFSIISGGPGTGKTTTVTRLLWLLTQQAGIRSNRIMLAAPTGKAAMRLQESIRQLKVSLAIPKAQAALIPEQASTLHRLLGYRPGTPEFRYHRNHLLPADVVIVDEASMIDIALMTRLVEAVPQQARLILLGDKDQLAAVETGSVFRDLCSATPAAQAHSVVLQKSWRFSADSGIGQLAAAVRAGAAAQLETLLQQDWPDIEWVADGVLNSDELRLAWQDYFELLAQQPTATAYTSWLEAVFAAFNRFRILTPLRQGMLGTEQLNQRLSQAFRRSGASSPTRSAWYHGRPVMVTQNDYRQSLFNGDIGLALRDNQGELRVWFQQEEGLRALSPVRLPAHETAWAMTIHKSQGSEFAAVMLLLPDDDTLRILGRELLYTGITRAKTALQLRGSLPVLQAALRQVTAPSSRVRQRLDAALAEVSR